MEIYKQLTQHLHKIQPEMLTLVNSIVNHNNYMILLWSLYVVKSEKKKKKKLQETVQYVMSALYDQAIAKEHLNKEDERTSRQIIMEDSNWNWKKKKLEIHEECNKIKQKGWKNKSHMDIWLWYANTTYGGLARYSKGI